MLPIAYAQVLPCLTVYMPYTPLGAQTLRAMDANLVACVVVVLLGGAQRFGRASDVGRCRFAMSIAVYSCMRRGEVHVELGCVRTAVCGC